jgi:hypothetical protein
MVSREGPLVPSLKGTRRARLVGCMAPDPYSQAVHRRTVGPASTSQHGDPGEASNSPSSALDGGAYWACLCQVGHGRQGGGRTADPPIFRTQDNSSPNTARVRDLHSRIDANANERGRTCADETKDEPTMAFATQWVWHLGWDTRRRKPSEGSWPRTLILPVSQHQGCCAGF